MFRCTIKAGGDDVVGGGVTGRIFSTHFFVGSELVRSSNCRSVWVYCGVKSLVMLYEDRDEKAEE